MGSKPGYDESSSYLNVREHRGGFLDLLRYLVTNNLASKASFIQAQEYDDDDECRTKPKTLKQFLQEEFIKGVSSTVLLILTLVRYPMNFIGDIIDSILNLLSIYGGFFGLMVGIITAKVEKPDKESVNFYSTVGQLDGRSKLFKGSNFLDQLESVSSGFTGKDEIKPGSRGLMDLCMMASKLAYENANVVKHVVEKRWGMNLVGILDCWNDFQRRDSKQVYILTDKQQDANVILITFRGTEPFDADDWAVDFDFSWYRVGCKGKLHMGFLEAMGLGNRNNISTFDRLLLYKEPKERLPDMTKKSAYFTILTHLTSLFSQHKNAKVVVTGHSLGGALAILFPTVLELRDEGDEIMKRLLGVYTFGQPRIANRRMCNFMKDKLRGRYFRIVYCNDIVPRLPYDDKFFLYKHFGTCVYYDCFYNETIGEDDEPDPNAFGLRYHMFTHITASWELVRGLTIGYTHGRDYKEGWFRILFRLMGLMVPGMSDHCSNDYVNSVRLGPKNNLPNTPLGRLLGL